MTQNDVRDLLLRDISRIKQAIGRRSNRVAKDLQGRISALHRVNLTSNKRVTDLGILIREVRNSHTVTWSLHLS